MVELDGMQNILSARQLGKNGLKFRYAFRGKEIVDFALFPMREISQTSIIVIDQHRQDFAFEGYYQSNIRGSC